MDCALLRQVMLGLQLRVHARAPPISLLQRPHKSSTSGAQRHAACPYAAPRASHAGAAVLHCSEPEVQVLLGLARALKPHVWLNVHSGMFALFTPYDHKVSPAHACVHCMRECIACVPALRACVHCMLCVHCLCVSAPAVLTRSAPRSCRVLQVQPACVDGVMQP